MTQSTQIAPGEGAGFGARLQQARVSAGLSLEDVSKRLKMPTRVVQSLEAGESGDPGSQVFVRGQLRSYARLLSVAMPAELMDAVPLAVAPPTLVSHTHTPRYRRVVEQVGRRAIYIVLTATIAAPVWLATRPGAGSGSPAVQSLELPADLAPAHAQASGPASARTPLVASMTSLPAAPAAGLDLTLQSDSWVELFAPDGRVLERGLLIAGQNRHFDAHQLGRVVIGNAAAVRVTRDGAEVDLAPFRRANVARFALSSDGSLAPVVD